MFVSGTVYREAAGLGWSRASRIKLRKRTRKLVVLQLRLEAGQRFCRLVDESRSSTALVPIAAWPALCGHNNAGDYEGSVPNPAPSSDDTPLGRRCAFRVSHD